VTIVVNGRFLSSRRTGIHRTARSILEAGRAHGLDLEVIAPADVDDPLADRIVTPLRGRVGVNLWEQVALPMAARGRLVLSLANTAPIALRTAAVIVHDLATLVEPKWFRTDMRLYGRFTLLAARRAQIVFAISRQIADELVDAGVSRERIRPLRWAIDSHFRPVPSDEVERVKQRFGLERPYVLHVGWADPRKDASLLVDAHVSALASHPHDLVLVGKPHPNFRAVQLPSLPSVRIVGTVSDSELPALMTGAVAFAYPSHYEGFGLPPLEAMACGTPAIVSDLPALHESAGEAATFLPPGDAPAWARAICDALDGNVREPRVPAWSWNDAAQQLADGLRR
jgi:glycosyltransferase involved in cell wall biosynthesis